MAKFRVHSVSEVSTEDGFQIGCMNPIIVGEDELSLPLALIRVSTQTQFRCVLPDGLREGFIS